MAEVQNVNIFSLKQVKFIAECSPDCNDITGEGVQMIAAATKYFLEYLTTEAYKRSCTGSLEYKHISEHVAEDNNMHFLREIVPKKIRVSELKKMLRQQGISYEFPQEGASNASLSNSQEKVMPLTVKIGPSTSYAFNNQQGYVSNFTDIPTTSYEANQENDSCSKCTSPSPSYSSLSSEVSSVSSTLIEHGEASDLF